MGNNKKTIWRIRPNMLNTRHLSILPEAITPKKPFSNNLMTFPLCQCVNVNPESVRELGCNEIHCKLQSFISCLITEAAKDTVIQLNQTNIKVKSESRRHWDAFHDRRTRREEKYAGALPSSFGRADVNSLTGLGSKCLIRSGGKWFIQHIWAHKNALWPLSFTTPPTESELGGWRERAESLVSTVCVPVVMSRLLKGGGDNACT